MSHLLTISATAAMLNQQVVTFAPEIKQQFRVGLEFENLLPFVAADKVYTSPNVTTGSILQPYQPRFTPNNTESWDAVDNTLRPIKADVEFTEEQLEKFYDKWAQNWFEAGKDPMQWTYPKYILEQVIMPQFKDDLNSAAWDGEYVAPTSGVPGAVLESVDGFRIAIVNALSAGKLVSVPSGSYTASDIQSKLEAWMLAMPAAVRGKSGMVLMSDSWMRKYYYDFREAFGTATWQQLNQQIGGLTVDGTKVRIVGIKAMEGSNRWIYLPDNDQNMIIGTRRGYPRDPQFIFDADLYTLRAKAVIYRFFGFEYWNNLYVNDQA
jgi:hypothetical protein